MAKVYLGDGVYASFDGFRIVLTTEDGITESNRIYVEPQVYEGLEAYARKVWEREEAGG
jgi:hypothetical protein